MRSVFSETLEAENQAYVFWSEADSHTLLWEKATDLRLPAALPLPLSPWQTWVLTKDEAVQLIAANHRTDKWLTTYLHIWHDKKIVKIGVKAFGKWVQRLERDGKPYWSGSECKSVADFKLAIESGLTYLLQEA